MKVATALIVASATLTSLAGASHHNHCHAHRHRKREVQTVTVEGPVEVAYVFEGQVISESEVCEGLNNHTFEWAQGTENQPNCNASPPAQAPAPAPSPSPAPAASSAAGGNEFVQKPTPPSSPSSAPSPQSGGSSSGGAADLHGYYAQIATNNNVDVEFEDGKLDCSTFPSDYGAVPVDWLGLQGWTGFQVTQISNGIPSDIQSPTSGNCGDSGDMFCSYACPEGFMKTQFPEQNSGTSVGGLECRNGKLHKTNSAYNTLCDKGAGSAQVQNNLDDVVCVCGTDYPGERLQGSTSNTTLPALILLQVLKLKPFPCVYKEAPAAS